MEENSVDKKIFNAYNGGQIIVANDQAHIQAFQRNNNIRIIDANDKYISRTLEYAKKWDEYMFLNNYNERDEYAVKNVKLKHVYPDTQLPHYIWKKNNILSKDLKKLLSEYIYVNSRDKMLLILGQPGIGKSTLITWITANFISRIDNILIYRFASDLNNIDWENSSLNYDISDEIINELGLSYDFLKGKILILDGFDEINILGDRAKILNSIYWKLIVENSYSNFSLIITCRENCIQNLYRIECDYITLQLWNKEQICNFCEKAFIANNPKAEYDTPQCKNKANVYKSRNKNKAD